MARCEVFEEQGGGWRYRAVWNDRPAEVSKDLYATAEKARNAAAFLPLTIVVLGGAEAPEPDAPPPRRRRRGPRKR